MEAIAISLSKGDLDAVKTRIGDKVQLTEALVWLAKTYGQGGMMLEKPYLDQLQPVLGASPTQETLVAAAEKGAQRSNGAFEARWTVPQDYEPALREHAQACGRDLNELITFTLQFAIENNWCLCVPVPPAMRIDLGSDQADLLRSLMGKCPGEMIHGTDLVEFIEQATGSPLLADTEPALVGA